MGHSPPGLVAFSLFCARCAMCARHFICTRSATANLRNCCPPYSQARIRSSQRTLEFEQKLQQELARLKTENAMANANRMERMLDAEASQQELDEPATPKSASPAVRI